MAAAFIMSLRQLHQNQTSNHAIRFVVINRNNVESAGYSTVTAEVVNARREVIESPLFWPQGTKSPYRSNLKNEQEWFVLYSVLFQPNLNRCFYSLYPGTASSSEIVEVQSLRNNSSPDQAQQPAPRSRSESTRRCGVGVECPPA